MYQTMEPVGIIVYSDGSGTKSIRYYYTSHHMYTERMSVNYGVYVYAYVGLIK